MTTATMTREECAHKLATAHRKCAIIETKAEEDNKGILTPAQATEHAALMAEINELKAMEFTEPKRKTSPNNGNFNEGTPNSGQNSDYVPSQNHRPSGRTYASMFGGDEQLENGGFKDAKEYARAVLMGHAHDQRLSNLSMGEYSDPAGGFAVPPQFAALMLDNSLENEIVRPRARIEPMIGKDKIVARWDGYDHSTGMHFGGLKSQWVAEGDVPATMSQGKLEQMTLVASRLFIYGKVTNQLLDDAPTFSGSLDGAVTAAIGFDLDSAFFRGTGVGMPLGILNDPAKITVSKESGQDAASIDYNNLCKMFARMYDAGRNRAFWVVNATAIPELLTLTIDIGVGGTHIPVMTRGPNGFEILTRPVIFTEKVPAIGTEGDISFIDFSQYTVGLRNDLRLDKSAHIGFATDETAFRAILRADGRGSWKSAVTPLFGNTQSWVVTLATRA